MTAPTTIVWFRGSDLRLADQPALLEAVSGGGPVVPVYVRDDEAAGPWAPGANARAWLATSLEALDRRLRERTSRLVIRAGAAEETLLGLAQETGATRLVSVRRCEPWAVAQAGRVRDALEAAGIDVIECRANLLAEPGEVSTGSGTPYRVFTPFWKAWRTRIDGEPAHVSAAPALVRSPASWPESAGTQAVRDPGTGSLVRSPSVLDEWTPGEGGALERLATFVHEAVAGYADGRDRPDLPGTSRLSPHLAHGEISPERILHVLEADGLATTPGGEAFIRQLAWREFAAHVLAAEPTLPERPVREGFERFPWREDPTALEAWQRGVTGFPLVDAGMRELLMTGWMHNRVRMVAASFLTKDLLIPWQVGQAWFWDNLVDADLANNAFGWQWVAGCGHDASPFFRVFNPTSQGRKFDAEGDYVRSWVPQLKGLPARWIHEPAAAAADALRDAGVELGDLYPEPIVDHAEARERALAAYEGVKRG